MMNFIKYHGTGNDFICLLSPPSDPSALALRLCDRHFGVGADGILYATVTQEADVQMHYYNADGSRAAMCANGLRCFARFLIDTQVLSGPTIKVQTDAGLVLARVEGPAVELRIPMPKPPSHRDPSSLNILGQELFVEDFLVPHAMVINRPGLDLDALGPALTHAPQFPQQINLNFVRVVDRSTLHVITHERGAGWTLSCGTGVCASALWASRRGLVDLPLTVEVPGGRLRVDVQADQVLLWGPAERVFAGQCEEDAA